jgi:hypothetical protein
MDSSNNSSLILSELINKSKNLDELTDNNKKILYQESLNIKPDILFEKLKDLENSSFKDHLIIDNVDNYMEKLIKDYPGYNKQQLVEKLIEDNPQHKDQILPVITITVDEQLNFLKNKYSEKDFNKLKKELLKEDLNELQSLSGNRSINKIRALRSVNKSHSNFLDEIKKAKDKTVDTDHYDNTMNLFD